MVRCECRRIFRNGRITPSDREFNGVYDVSRAIASSLLLRAKKKNDDSRSYLHRTACIASCANGSLINFSDRSVYMRVADRDASSYSVPRGVRAVYRARPFLTIL